MPHRAQARCCSGPAPAAASRREFLAGQALGIGGVALAYLLGEEKLLAAVPPKPHDRAPNDLRPRAPQFPAQAKAMISLFMHGGPSHVDLLDPKPELSRLDGQTYDGEVNFSFTNVASRKLLASPFKFEKRGQSGLEISELLPHLAEMADDICVVRSMHTGHNGHEVSIRYFHGGIPGVTGRPTVGAWMVYGLGSESQELPAYVVLSDPSGPPVDAAVNWTGGFMPPLFQGTLLRAAEPRIANLDPPERLRGLPQQQNLQLLESLNRQHLAAHGIESELEARIACYELAAKMQSSAKEALDLAQETEATQKLYGLDDPVTKEYGTRCLIARRLVERGVRFVQLFLDGQPWDTHSDLKANLPPICRRTDKPSAALVQDLKDRGLLDTTVVHWGGEIGRLPLTQSDGTQIPGRDHNGQGFSMWLAGGGFRGGMTYGATDEIGHRAAENIVTPNDYQATLLHQFGIDHQKLVFQHNGMTKTLTDGRPARVIGEIINAGSVRRPGVPARPSITTLTGIAS